MQEVAKEFVISVLKSQVKLVWGKAVDTLIASLAFFQMAMIHYALVFE